MNWRVGLVATEILVVASVVMWYVADAVSWVARRYRRRNK